MEKKMAAEVEELPKTIVRRVVKDKLLQLSPDQEISVLKDALTAFSESARIFIHYLSATANDICKESKRQTINADDILKALDDIEFSEFNDSLRASLEEFRRKTAGKKAAGASKEKDQRKRRKMEVPSHSKDDKTEPDGEDRETEEENGSQ